MKRTLEPHRRTLVLLLLACVLGASLTACPDPTPPASASNWDSARWDDAVWK